MSTSWSTDSGEVVVGVVGVTGSGKSSLIKRITECEDIVPGDGVNSVTQEIGQYQFQWGGTRYVLVDTPGFDDSDRDDEDVFLQLARWTARSFQAGQRMNGLLYLHPIISNRERGSEMRNLRMFKKICGENNYANVVLGLTFCDQEEDSVIAMRQNELVCTPEWWGDMISRGSRIERIPLERQACIDLLSQFAPKKKLTLNIQSEVVEKGLAINDTEAAQTIAHKQELEAIRAEEKRKLASMRANFEMRMKSAREDYARKLIQERQRFESIRRRQQIQEQTLALQGKLQEELERREKLLRMEEEAQEKEQANELARLQEQIRQITLENDKLEAKRNKNAGSQRSKPWLADPARYDNEDWGTIHNHTEASGVKQAYVDSRSQLAYALLERFGSTMDSIDALTEAIRDSFPDLGSDQSSLQSFAKDVIQRLSEDIPKYRLGTNRHSDIRQASDILYFLIITIGFQHGTEALPVPANIKMPFLDYKYRPFLHIISSEELFSACDFSLMSKPQFLSGRWRGYYSDHRTILKRDRAIVVDPPMQDIHMVVQEPSESAKSQEKISAVVARETRGHDAHGNFRLFGRVTEDGTVSLTKRYISRTAYQLIGFTWSGHVTPFGIVGTWRHASSFGGHFWIYKDEWVKSDSRETIPTVETCTALYSYEAQEEGDLTLVRGDTIEIVTRTQNENDWWTGKIRGKQGVFPGNYVKLI